jgi:hypothetical protein
MTGEVWQLCEALARVPKSDRACMKRVVLETFTAVRDTGDEFAEELSEGSGGGWDAFDDFDEVTGEIIPCAEGADDDAEMTERERAQAEAAVALVRMVQRLLRRVCRTIGAAAPDLAPFSVRRLDEAVAAAEAMVSKVTDLGMCLYTPVDAEGLKKHAAELAEMAEAVGAGLSSPLEAGEDADVAASAEDTLSAGLDMLSVVGVTDDVSDELAKEQKELRARMEGVSGAAASLLNLILKDGEA